MNRVYFMSLGLLVGLGLGWLGGNSSTKTEVTEIRRVEHVDSPSTLRGNGPALEEIVNTTPEAKTLEAKTVPREVFDLSEENGIYDFSDIEQPTGSTPLERFLNSPEWYFANPDLGRSDLIAIAKSSLMAQRYKSDLTEPGITKSGYACGELWIPGLNNGVYAEFQIDVADDKPANYDFTFKFPALTTNRKPFHTEVDLKIALYFDEEVYDNKAVSIEVEPDSMHMDASPNVRFTVINKDDKYIPNSTHTEVPKKDVTFFKEDWKEFLELKQDLDTLYEVLQR